MIDVNKYQQKYQELKQAVADFEEKLPANMLIVDGNVVLNDKVIFLSMARYAEDTKSINIILKCQNPDLYLADIQTLLNGLKIEFKNPYNRPVSEQPKLTDFQSVEFQEAFRKVPKNQIYFSLVLSNLIENRANNREYEKVIEHIIYDGIESSQFFLRDDKCFSFFREDDESSFLGFGQMSLADFEEFKKDIAYKYTHQRFFKEEFK